MSLWIYDWGIGGLSVVQALARREPTFDFTYFSDAGFTPYGTLPKASLAARVAAVLNWAQSAGASHVVIACNAAGSALTDELVPAGLSVTDILDTSWKVVIGQESTRVGIVGGIATIRNLQSRKDPPGMTICKLVAQPLSALIEKGDLASAEFTSTLTKIFTPLASCQVVVLACTHYPAATAAIQKVLPAAQLVDPAEHLHLTLLPGAAARRYLTTGDPDHMRRAARAAFGEELPPVESVSLAPPAS